MRGTNPVHHNIIANFAGGAWVSLISLVFVPFFIKLIGVEAYGLISIFISLTALLAVLDLGLSSTLSRELSRLSVVSGSEQEARDLVKTFEIVYWSVGMLVGLAVVFLAPFIARYWVNAQGIPVGTVKSAIMLMGLSVAFQWPSALYSGGLMGLQHQVLLNVVKMVLVTFQYGGAILILWFVSPTILTFFTWQLFISLVSTVVLTICLWGSLPGSGLKVHFSRWLLRKNWRFAAGMTSIAVLVTILTQLDKIILSKMLTLESFGYYALAFSLASILSQLATPISSALFPRFSQIVAIGDVELLSSIYHKGCQLIAAVVLPVAAILAFFSKEILLIWLRDPLTVANTHNLLSLLAIGTAINTLLILPYIVQLAHGLIRLVFLQNAVSVVLLVPLMIWMVNHYGPAGAAIVWIILNTAYVFILIPIMHARILKTQMWQWYFFDVALPVIGTFIIAFCARMIMPNEATMSFVLGGISTTYLACLLFLLVSLPVSRKKTVQLFLSWALKRT